MQMRGPIEPGSEINGIESGHDGFEPIFPLLIADGPSPILKMLIVGSMNNLTGLGMWKTVRAVVSFMVIPTRRVGAPHDEDGVWDRLARFRIQDSAA